MTLNNPTLRNLALSAATVLELTLWVSPSIARDLRLDLPAGAALRHPEWRTAYAQGIEFRFGKEPDGTYSDLSLPVQATNYARPTVILNGRSVPREDRLTCNEALRNTLGDLAEQARKRGSNAVVNIVTRFVEEPLDSKNQFTCNAGIGSAVVELTAQFAIVKPNQGNGATSLAANAANTSPAVASPAVATPVVARSVAGLGAVNYGLTGRVFPPSTQHAALDNIEAIPFIGPGCKNFYTNDWLKTQFPRAFAVAPNGFCHGSWSYTPKNTASPKDPAVRALEDCQAKAGITCQLYAVDDQVVFKHGGIADEDMKAVAVR